MYGEELFLNLTVKENLSLPLIFKAIDREVRDEIIFGFLTEKGLTGAANKFLRYLTVEESEKFEDLRREVWETYPCLGEFLKELEEGRSSKLCLPLLQREVFGNISNGLKKAVEEIKVKNFTAAARTLEEIIDKLALRMILSPFYETPSARVIEISVLVVRNYRDLFKHREKVRKEIIKAVEGRTMPNLMALADSFSEMS